MNTDREQLRRLGDWLEAANRIKRPEYTIDIHCGNNIYDVPGQGMIFVCPACRQRGYHQVGCLNMIYIDMPQGTRRDEAATP